MNLFCQRKRLQIRYCSRGLDQVRLRARTTSACFPRGDIRKRAIAALHFVNDSRHSAHRFLSFGFLKTQPNVLSDLNAVRMRDFWRTRPNRSDALFTYGKTASPNGLSRVRLSWALSLMHFLNRWSGLSNMLSQPNTTSIRKTPRSSSVLYSAVTARGFSWNRGTPLWTARLLTNVKRFPSLTCLEMKMSQTHGFEREHKRTHISSSDECEQESPRIK